MFWMEHTADFFKRACSVEVQASLRAGMFSSSEINKLGKLWLGYTVGCVNRIISILGDVLGGGQPQWTCCRGFSLTWKLKMISTARWTLLPRFIQVLPLSQVHIVMSLFVPHGMIWNGRSHLDKIQGPQTGALVSWWQVAESSNVCWPREEGIKISHPDLRRAGPLWWWQWLIEACKKARQPCCSTQTSYSWAILVWSSALETKPSWNSIVSRPEQICFSQLSVAKRNWHQTKYDRRMNLKDAILPQAWLLVAFLFWWSQFLPNAEPKSKSSPNQTKK